MEYLKSTQKILGGRLEMGLDMYVNKVNTVIDSQQELEHLLLASQDKLNVPLVVSVVGYFRKHSDLHGYFEGLWKDRSYRNLKFSCDPLLLLTKEDIEIVISRTEKHLKTGDGFEEANGFFWGASTEEDWKETIRLFREILETTNFSKESVFYDSWW